MKKFLLALVFVMGAGNVGVAQIPEPIIKVVAPVEVKQELKTTAIPKELEGLQWNRWTSKNFVVLSLNDTQAQYLHKHLESIKTWIFSRWGLYDINFSAPCKLICVDDPRLFEKLFKIGRTHVEIRKENGKIKESVIFLLITDDPAHTIPVPLSEVCYLEFEQQYQANFSWAAIRGMAVLNGAIDQIRAYILELKPVVDSNQPLYFSKGLLEMTADQYAAESQEKKHLYDQCAMAFILMIRKEFGQEKLHAFLKTHTEEGPVKALATLGFKGYDDFDMVFKRYLLDITREIANKKAPDSYLQIREN